MKDQNTTNNLRKRGITGTEEVEKFLATFEHPLMPEVLELRRIILAVDPNISEGIKWNVPSFRTSEYFATFHLRSNEFVQVILHLGAKIRDSSTSGVDIADPEALLQWLAKDRAAVKFSSLEEIRSKQPAFEQIIRQWIHLV